MQYTLKQAESALTQYSNAYGVTNVKDAINRSIAALAQMANWQCLRKVLRFSSVGPCFTLPQGYAGLVRACVNGRPTTVRGQDFSFIHSGPGDLVNPPVGFDPVEPGDIRDIGTQPTYVIPPAPCRLFAFTDAEDTSSESESESDDGYVHSEPSLLVRGVDPSGRTVSTYLPMQQAPVYNSYTGALSSGVSPEEAVVDTTVFSTITEVVVGESATGYITLYAEDYATSKRYMISLYHPEVKAPFFRHYRIMNRKEDEPVEILAEVRLDPLPLINETDVLPIDTIEPIEWMIMADWKLKSSEVDAAQKYQALAANWMKSKEVAENTVQTAVVVNNRLAGSMFEVSNEAWNI